jgi:hypothetical protein
MLLQQITSSCKKEQLLAIYHINLLLDKSILEAVHLLSFKLIIAGMQKHNVISNKKMIPHYRRSLRTLYV